MRTFVLSMMTSKDGKKYWCDKDYLWKPIKSARQAKRSVFKEKMAKGETLSSPQCNGWGDVRYMDEPFKSRAHEDAQGS